MQEYAAVMDELSKLTLDNRSQILKIGMSRMFSITSRRGSVCHIEIVKAYITIRLQIKTDNARLFMRYQSSQANQLVGINTLLRSYTRKSCF